MDEIRRPEVAILGFGAVGTAVAWHLQQAQIAYAVLARDFRVSLSRHQLMHDGQSFEVAGSKHRLADLRLILITVRAVDLQSALAEIAAQRHFSGVVVPLCNGNVERLLQAFAVARPDTTVRAGSVDFGVSRHPQGGFEYFGRAGTVTWGPCDLAASSIPTDVENMLTNRLSHFHYAQNGLWICRRKWLVNTVINTLCGALDLAPNRRISERPTERDRLFEEAFELGRRLWGDWPFAKDALKAQVDRVVQDTAENTNSMVRDLRLGRISEVAFLSGLANGLEGFPLLQDLTLKIESRTHSIGFSGSPA